MSTDKKENITLDFSSPKVKTVPEEEITSSKSTEKNKSEENSIKKSTGNNTEDNTEKESKPKDKPIDKPTEPELSPLEVAQKEASELKNQYAYLRAEFENYKKNTAKEQIRLIRFGAENLMLDILKISDLFQIALQTEITEQNYENTYTGFKMTADELSRSLESHGLKTISTKNENFDPHLHEAISSENSETVPHGEIIKEYKIGYTLHDKVIRPSQVIVSGPKPESEDNEK